MEPERQLSFEIVAAPRSGTSPAATTTAGGSAAEQVAEQSAEIIGSERAPHAAGPARTVTPRGAGLDVVRGPGDTPTSRRAGTLVLRGDHTAARAAHLISRSAASSCRLPTTSMI